MNLKLIIEDSFLISFYSITVSKFINNMKRIIILLFTFVLTIGTSCYAQGTVSRKQPTHPTTSKSKQKSKTSSTQVVKVPTELIQVGNNTIEMVLVDGEEYNRHDEAAGGKGVYSVKPFMISKFVITESLWKQIMGYDRPHGQGPNYPASCDWLETSRFIEELNRATGRNFRLPTELEWEFAASGGKYTHGYKYAGSNNLNNVGWHGGINFHPVGKKKPNEIGIYDMSGNTFEWTNDYVPGSNNRRIVKGGQVNYYKEYCEIKERLEPWFNNAAGIRLVLDIN